MQLFVLLARLPNVFCSIAAAPDDSIASVLDTIAPKLAHSLRSSDFVAYAATRGGEWTLRRNSAAYIALQRGDPVVMDRYLSLATQLDRNKTVKDYFGSIDKPEHVAIIADVTPEGWAARARRLEPKLKESTEIYRGFLSDWSAQISTPLGDKMLLRAVVPSVRDLVVTVAVGPDDSSQELNDMAAMKALALLEERIPSITGPQNFRGFIAKRNGAWPLQRGAPDLLALERNDVDIVAQYCTPSTRLSSFDTVGECVGKHGPPDNAIAVVMIWFPPVDEVDMIRRELARQEEERVEQGIQRRKTTLEKRRQSDQTHDSSASKATETSAAWAWSTVSSWFSGGGSYKSKKQT